MREVQSNESSLRIGIVFVFLTLFSAVVLHAQVATVDPTFNPIPSNPLPTDTSFQQVVQPDGKVIVYGAPYMFVNGELRSGIFRLNADGSTDTTFLYNNEGNVGVGSIGFAPDGKIILAGSTSPNHAKMVRLNPDGTLDNAFSVLITASGPPEFTGNWFTVNAVQPDGKVIATHTSWGNIAGTWYSYSMRRYNVDGSIDASFTSPTLDGGHLVSTNALIELLPDGRFYLAITSRSHLGGSMGISRRLANGTVDPTYAAFTQTIFPSAFLSFERISIASDGGVLAAGILQQTSVGFPPREQLRRFNPDGTSTPGFASPLVMTASEVHQLPDGKILYTAGGGTVSRPLIRLEANGAVDATYVLDPAVTAIKNKWRVDQLNRPVFLAGTAAGPRLVRLLENGSIDPSFNPILGSPGTTRIVVSQPDGKVIVGGSFAAINGTLRSGFARLNADGSVDNTFDPGTGFNSVPRHMIVLPDGKILVMGGFNTYKGTPVSRILRLNSDGSVDGTFTISITGTSVLSAAIQPDGKILIGGVFSMVNGESRTCLARIDANGALDATFNPVLGVTSGGGVSTVVVDPSGKVAFGGTFTTVNGIDRANLARVDSIGANDTSFDPGGLPSTNRLYLQPDGKYILLNRGAGIFRRNYDGSPDPSFTPPVFTHPSFTEVITVLLRSDGSMIIGGSFGSVGGTPRWYITRLKPNGTHDAPFLTTGANADVTSIVAWGTDKAVIAGNFNSLENVAKFGIARLNVPVLQRKTLFDFNGDGRADFTVYRPSTGQWYELFSDGSPYAAPVFGLAGDIPIPADYDGDGITDEAIFRPSNGDWWYLSSVNGVYGNIRWGMAGDLPRPFDFDGDGKADIVVYRPSNQTWYRVATSGIASPPFVFGAPGDQPVTGDFDGDGKGDMAIFRPSSGDWWYAASSAGNAFRSALWGQTGDIPVPADYDGDGKTDHAVFRPSNGGWYIYKSSTSSHVIFGFGVNGDRPVSADYDGDGKADAAVFRPSDGIWYVMQSTAGTGGAAWGVASDAAIPNVFLP